MKPHFDFKKQNTGNLYLFLLPKTDSIIKNNEMCKRASAQETKEKDKQ